MIEAVALVSVLVAFLTLCWQFYVSRIEHSRQRYERVRVCVSNWYASACNAVVASFEMSIRYEQYLVSQRARDDTLRDSCDAWNESITAWHRRLWELERDTQLLWMNVGDHAIIREASSIRDAIRDRQLIGKHGIELWEEHGHASEDPIDRENLKRDALKRNHQFVLREYSEHARRAFIGRMDEWLSGIEN